MAKPAPGRNGKGTTRSADARPPSESASDLQIAYLAPDRLHAAPNNARTHSKKQLKQLARSIERFGFVNPVLISDDFEIIAGHGRVEAAKRLGFRQIPTVLLSNLTPADRRAYVIADNRLAELAGWDRALLAIELQGLLDLSFDDIALTGFSLGEVDLMLEAVAEGKPKKPKTEVPADNGQDVAVSKEVAVSKAGDRWLLEPHRLLCGEGDPLSCDVVVRRWQRDSGKVARLEGSDATFAEVAAARMAEPNASAHRADRKQ